MLHAGYKPSRRSLACFFLACIKKRRLTKCPPRQLTAVLCGLAKLGSVPPPIFTASVCMQLMRRCAHACMYGSIRTWFLLQACILLSREGGMCARGMLGGLLITCAGLCTHLLRWTSSRHMCSHA